MYVVVIVHTEIISAVHFSSDKILSVFLVNFTWIASMGQLHLDSSIRKMKYLVSKTIFSDSPLARMITGFIKVLPFGCSFLFTGDMISYCSRMSSILFFFIF